MGKIFRDMTAEEQAYYDEDSKKFPWLKTITMSAHPIEVKSGKDYTEHSALNNLLKVPEYNVLAATVISNEHKVYQEGKVTYMPVYFVMFFDERSGRAERMEADTPQTDEEEYFF